MSPTCANGHPLENGQRFCGACGAAAVSSSLSETETQPVAGSTSRRRLRWWLPAGAVLAALVVAAVLGNQSRLSGGQQDTAAATPAARFSPTAQSECARKTYLLLQNMADNGFDQALIKDVRFTFGTESDVYKAVLASFFDLRAYAQRQGQAAVSAEATRLAGASCSASQALAAPPVAATETKPAGRRVPTAAHAALTMEQVAKRFVAAEESGDAQEAHTYGTPSAVENFAASGTTFVACYVEQHGVTGEDLNLCRFDRPDTSTSETGIFHELQMERVEGAWLVTGVIDDSTHWQ